jgi:hypothetical protein
MNLASIARALGGEVSADQVRCPGPNHSKADRSLSIRIGRDGKLVHHGFSGDSFEACDSYIRSCLGLPQWEPESRKPGSLATLAGGTRQKAKRETVFDFYDPETGELRYKKVRIDTDEGKSFYFSPKERGGSPPLLYGANYLADLLPGQPIFLVEGELKVNRLRELGAVAVSGDSGQGSKWLPSHAELLRGLDIILWPDSDAPGEQYIANAARCLRGHAASLRVGLAFGKPDGTKGRDACDWEGEQDDLAALVTTAEPYSGELNAHAHDEQQEEPLPLFPPLPEAAACPIDALGSVLSRAAKAIARCRCPM